MRSQRRHGGILTLFVAVLMLIPPASGARAQLLAVADLGVMLQLTYDQDLVVRVSNDGPSPASGVANVTLAPDVTALDLPAGCASREQVITCETAQMLPGARTSFPIELAQAARGPQPIAARVASSAVDPVPTNDQDGTAVETLPSPRPGADVIATAVSVSQLRFDGFPTPGWVVLARHDAFADALTGTTLTGRAPLLYTQPDQLDPRTEQEIARLLPDGGLVYVLGGPAAVGEEVVARVQAAGHEVRRLAGDDRIATALAVADEVVRLADAADGAGGSAVRAVALARADGEGSSAWADSIAAGAWAAAERAPILLSPRDGLPSSVAAWVAERAPDRTVLLGGPSALSDAVAAALRAAERVEGTDRAATAVAIARQLRSGDLPPRGFHLVNGYAADGWAYGLLAAGLAADEEAPVLFVDTTQAPPATVAAVTSCRSHPVPLAVVGGSDMVAASVRAQLDELDASTCE